MTRTFPCIMAAGLVSVALAETAGFDSSPLGSAPKGWALAMTHSGGIPQWEVRKDDSAPSPPAVFAQVSTDATRGRFPLAIYQGATVKDGTVSVSFKPVSGEIDQAAGLVWRYRDPDNYYVVRANALEDNVVLYKVEKGTRTALPPKGTPADTYGVKHPVPKQAWSQLSVTFRGNLFAVSCNGQQLFEVEDSTFTEPGKTGLWTKADSVTYFDDFRVDTDDQPR